MTGVNTSGLGLDLDASPPRMYYSRHPNIESALLDGTDQTIVVEFNIIPTACPNDLVVDSPGDTIYVSTCVSPDSVFRMDLDGGNLALFASNAANTQLALGGGRMYFVVRDVFTSRDELWSVASDGSDLRLVRDFDRKIYDVDIEAANGHVYVVTIQLTRIDLDGTNETPIVAPLEEAHGVAMADDGSIFYGDTNAFSIVTAAFDGGKRAARGCWWTASGCSRSSASRWRRRLRSAPRALAKTLEVV